MTRKQKISFETHGTSLLTRMRSTLDPEYFGIDERSMSDLMVFILEFSKKVLYTNYNNKIEGDWAPFFENNLAFLLAQISCADTEHFNSRFKRAVFQIENEIDSEDKKSNLRELIKYTFDLFETIDQWYKTSKYDLVHIEENKLVEQLQSAISLKLNPHLNVFQEQLDLQNAKYFKGDEIQFAFEKFDHIWQIKKDTASAEDASTELLNFKISVKDISIVHKAALGVITYLKTISPKLLGQVIEDYPYHSPHISLFLSFLKLFGHVQQDLNRIVQRHLDYYYGSVLKQALRPAEPDHVHVYFEPAEHILKTMVPAGTLLAAGTDEEGIEYTYITDHNLELNQAVITDLKVIHVAQNPLIGIGSTYKAVSNIYARSVLMNEEGMALDKDNNPASFDTFGKDQADISFIHRDMQQAQIGFALASPILLLKEGERKINITYKFNLKSLSSLISFIEEITINEKLSPDNAFYKILNNIFSVKVTTISGWFQTDRYKILPPDSWTDGEVKIDLLFDVADPPIIAYDEEIHGMGFSTQWPVLEFILSSEHAMYGYSYLRDLIIEECRIDVSVSQAKDLQVFNDLGKLDINKPFYPFGTTPDLGSYFLIGNEEVFRKIITDLSLDIHWHNLPKNDGGFEAYYKEYKQGIKTDSFKVGITGLSDFQFTPVEDKNVQHLDLYVEGKSKGKLNERLHIDNIDLEKLKLKPNYMEMDLTDYNSRTRSGFLKLEITGPKMGFSFSEYSKLFSEAVMENSKVSSGLLSSKAPKKVGLPNEPYAPQIRSISLNYSATALLTMNPDRVAENDKFSRDQIYHILPFGKRIVFENGLPNDTHLAPQYDDEGYLIIGLENIQAPVELSVYFQLEDNVKNEINYTNIPSTTWRYLVDNEWVNLEESALIFDGTNNFTTSGIVQLKLPASINTDHDILPSDKYWISVSSETNTQILSKTVLVKTNSVGATWNKHKAEAQWKENVPKETISGLIDTRTDINGVYQPFPSFGGRAMESSKHYYTRVSERLKHKNRAITPEDYEKLILDHFPYIFQVKCINNFSHPDFVKKGSIKIIVVPKLFQTKTLYEPKVDYNQLDMIEGYLKKMISPFAHIEVVNPVFEKVRISCRVRMANDKNSGELVKRLETDLKTFVCPWFGVSQKEMDFGGSIERDDVLSFIESLSYVKFVTKLSIVVLHYKDGEYSLSDSATDEGKTNVLYSSTPWSVLIPDEDHEIELIDKSVHETPEETRIETMKIGADFVILDDREEEVDFPFFDLDKDTYYAIEIDL